MIWTLHRQQQQCGAQLHARPGALGGKVRQPREAPDEATKGREAQDHEQAGGVPQAGESPASEIAHRGQDNTPSAPDDPRVEWDDVVQPERQRRQGRDFDDLPLPEGK